MLRMLYYTATIITMDGSDTNAYGEACEPGHGYTELSGWWNPDLDHWSVHPDRDQVQPDTYPASGELAPAQWLAAQLTDRLGPIDHFDGERTFYSARDATGYGHPTGSATLAPTLALVAHDAIFDRRHHANPTGTKTLTAAGHAHGFTDQEIGDAARLLGVAMRGNPTWQQDRAAAADRVPADRLTGRYQRSSAAMRGFAAPRFNDPITLPCVPDLPPHPHEPGTHQGRSR